MSSDGDVFVSSASGGVMRPKWLFLALAALCALFALPLVGFAAATGIWMLLTLLVNCLLFGSMALRYALTSTRRATFDTGTLTVDAKSALWLDRRMLARRDDLRQGFVVPKSADGYTLVRFERRRPLPPLFVRVSDEAEGTAMLRALGFDAEHVAAEMKLASGLLSMGVGKQMLVMILPLGVVLPGILLASTTFEGKASYAILAPLALLIGYLMTLSFAPTTVRIGTDGIYTRWLGRERFHPFSTIHSTSVYDEHVMSKRQHGVRLLLHNGRTVRIAAGQTDIGAGDASRLSQRIREALEARKAGAVHSAHPTDILIRGHRTVVEWVRELRRIGAGASSHRTASVPLDMLLSVVEDTAASEADRASAALAAVASREEATAREAKRRVRVAAETTASPKLRVALTRIADVSPTADADEDLASTLEALSTNKAKQA